jgi:hypothetical protein
MENVLTDHHVVSVRVNGQISVYVSGIQRLNKATDFREIWYEPQELQLHARQSPTTDIKNVAGLRTY